MSGPPLHIRSGVDNSLTGVGWDRPDLVGSPYRDHTNRDDFINAFFNTAAFAANQPARMETSGGTSSTVRRPPPLTSRW